MLMIQIGDSLTAVPFLFNLKYNYYEDEKDDEMRYHTILPTNIQVDLEDKTIIVMWN